jgi:hypothetical protein
MYLSDAGMERSITTISSVSGGSITNAKVSLCGVRELNADRMPAFAAVLARKLSGNLGWFVAMLLLHLAAWGVAVVGAGGHNLWLFVTGLGIAVVLSIIGAPYCRDATFGQRLTWLYLDVVFATVGLLAFSVGEGLRWIACVLLVGTVLMFRGVIVGWAIGSSTLDGARKKTLADTSEYVDHVLCACDVPGRYHVYFSRDFTYSYGVGLGARGKLPLSAAVQASADLPGAFPPRPMLAGAFDFTGGEHDQTVLVLTDGGVYDNMADEWLIGYSERLKRLTESIEKIGTHPSTLVKREWMEKTRDHLSEKAPNFIIVANASGSLDYKFAWRIFLPILGEVFSILRVKSILYDNGNSTRRRMIFKSFKLGEQKGIIVNISTDPWDVVKEGLKKKYPAEIRTRAEDAGRCLNDAGLSEESTDTPAGAATVLYPLKRGTIAALLQRSYAMTCIQASIWHNLPLEKIPSIEWFEALELGRTPPRTEHI